MRPGRFMVGSKCSNWVMRRSLWEARVSVNVSCADRELSIFAEPGVDGRRAIAGGGDGREERNEEDEK